MSENDTEIVAQNIELHQKSRLLEITFSDGQRFEYPCEYLRVKSHAAEMRTMDKPLTGKEDVNIKAIESQGSYAIRIVFDDGHDTGIYSWGTLYDLGRNRERYWQEYLDALNAIGYERKATRAGNGEKIQVTVLYFVQLPDVFGKDSEQIVLPKDVETVEQLLAMLRQRGKQYDDLLQPERVTVTVNKQFAELFTRLDYGDEVAIVPKPM